MQTALVSYQIAWSWPLRWEEITQKIADDFHVLLEIFESGQANDSWWLKTMKSSRYNKRLYNNKANRIAKFFEFYQDFHHDKYCYSKLYNDMNLLWEILAKSLKSPKDAKTTVFAVKMFPMRKPKAATYHLKKNPLEKSSLFLILKFAILIRWHCLYNHTWSQSVRPTPGQQWHA